jgi:hypothetical protein
MSPLDRSRVFFEQRAVESLKFIPVTFVLDIIFYQSTFTALRNHKLKYAFQWDFRPEQPLKVCDRRHGFYAHFTHYVFLHGASQRDLQAEFRLKRRQSRSFVLVNRRLYFQARPLQKLFFVLRPN